METTYRCVEMKTSNNVDKLFRQFIDRMIYEVTTYNIKLFDLRPTIA
jgi:hypothetical protein